MWIEIITNNFLSVSGYVIGLLSLIWTIYTWGRGRKMDKMIKKQLYLQNQKLINEQSKIMDEGSEIRIHGEIAGEVYRKIHERKFIINESIEFVDKHLEMKMSGKKNFERFRVITCDSTWVLSNFDGDDSKEVEKTIEKKWSIFKQRMNRSLQAFKEIEKEYMTKKIII